MTDPRLPIEFWFDFGSNYSYLAAMRIEQAAAAAGKPVEWHPFLLGPIFRSFGWETSPFVLQPQKGAYVWRDMARECARLGLPWRQPTSFPRASVLAHRLALAAREQAWAGAFCRAVMRCNFVDDLDIGAEDVIAQVLEDLGQPVRPWLDRAASPQVKAALREATEAAHRRGVFGAPTFFVGTEMFWGHDRLEQALAWQIR